MDGISTFFTRSTSLVVINGKYFEDIYFHVIQNNQFLPRVLLLIYFTQH